MRRAIKDLCLRPFDDTDPESGRKFGEITPFFDKPIGQYNGPTR